MEGGRLFKMREAAGSQVSSAYDLVLGDAFTWLERRSANSIHAIVTDPPYGLPLREKDPGNWRIEGCGYRAGCSGGDQQAHAIFRQAQPLAEE